MGGIYFGPVGDPPGVVLVSLSLFYRKLSISDSLSSLPKMTLFQTRLLFDANLDHQNSGVAGFAF